MRVSVTDAKAQLTDLVRRAEAGDDVILTRHGQAVIRLTPVMPAARAPERRAIIAAVRAAAVAKMTAGNSAAQNENCLYDEDGLPG